MTHHADIRRDLLHAALATANRGWPVIPLRPGSKVFALHGERDCPGTGQCANGHAKPEQRATTDPALIRAAWETRPFNVGLATGPAGLVVIDLDAPKPSDPPGTHHGSDILHNLCTALGETLPATHTVATPSGGLHLYFTAPPGARIGSNQDILGRHIDHRAWGGYVAAPGSRFAGRSYEITDDRPPAPLPDWMHRKLTAPPRIRAVPFPSRTSGPRPGRRAAYADAALRNEENNVATAAKGGRNKALVRAARALGRLVASGDLGREEVEGALSRGAEAAELKPYEYRSAITSALNWSIANNPGPRATA
ncbi:bifunctional DNA primase/polymerase [Streptomyces sp. NPDC093225]|uniref:bifunctional DNA primase/polymerase n=1 Tax=Streptomyces sp. NPDC093225 TaxID=3366034 RepID=UPI00381FD085